MSAGSPAPTATAWLTTQTVPSVAASESLTGNRGYAPSEGVIICDSASAGSQGCA